MMKPPCPVCGDPKAFPLWIDKEPPGYCPNDPAMADCGPRTIKNVTECSYQMAKAKQRARWMKICLEAFEPDGKLKTGMLGYVLERAQGDEPLVI